jgi:hypothetical protein
MAVPTRIASRIKEMYGLPSEEIYSIYQDNLAKLLPYGDKAKVNTRMAKDLGVGFVDELSENPYAEMFVETANSLSGDTHEGVAALAYKNDQGNRIWIKPDLPPQRQDRLKTHELSHLYLDHLRRGVEPLLAELEAEGTAYGVGYRLGQPDDANLNTVASYLTPYFQQHGQGLDINETIASRLANIKTVTDRFTKGVL